MASFGSTPFDSHKTLLLTPLSVLNELFEIELVMSGCPITTSAGAWLASGMLFQISTRLWPRSVTNSFTPSEVTETGFSMLLGLAFTATWEMSGSTKVEKLGWPSTRSAGTPLEVGICRHTSTRWFCVSATYNLPF